MPLSMENHCDAEHMKHNSNNSSKDKYKQCPLVVDDCLQRRIHPPTNNKQPTLWNTARLLARGLTRAITAADEQS